MGHEQSENASIDCTAKPCTHSFGCSEIWLSPSTELKSFSHPHTDETADVEGALSIKIAKYLCLPDWYLGQSLNTIPWEIKQYIFSFQKHF